MVAQREDGNTQDSELLKKLLYFIECSLYRHLKFVLSVISHNLVCAKSFVDT